jgi:hypothetical protein
VCSSDLIILEVSLLTALRELKLGESMVRDLLSKDSP